MMEKTHVNQEQRQRQLSNKKREAIMFYKKINRKQKDVIA